MSTCRYLLIVISVLHGLTLRCMDHYVVRIPDATARLVHVEATINMTEPMLLMSPFGADHLEHGWATFVQDLKATVHGSPLEVELLAGGAFNIATEAGSVIKLSYSVRIEHDLTTWPFGSDEAAYVKGDMMMATGNALFITRLDLDSAQVRFEMPEHYSVASAWHPTYSNTYLVKGAEELVWTVLLLGEFQKYEIKAGDMRVLLAYGNDLLDAREKIIDITSRAIDTYTTYYGGPPSTTGSQTYLQVINVDTAFEGGGAAFTNSMSILLSDHPGTCDSISTYCWHHIIIHELGHLWNGYSLVVAEPDQWFLEGFTDYLAFRLQRDIGLFTDAQWDPFIKWKEAEAAALRRGCTVTLAEAGEDKGANYDLIYSGGFQFAHQLNEAIAMRTNKRSDLLDVMRSLYTTHAGKGVPVDRTVLRKAAERICACELGDLFGEMLDRP